MSDYINRDIAIARLTALEVQNPIATMRDAKRVLADIPAADAVEVTRCTDCKHFNPDDQAAEDADWCGWCRYNGCLTDDFDFCSRGIDKDFLDGGNDDATDHV